MGKTYRDLVDFAHIDGARHGLGHGGARPDDAVGALNRDVLVLGLPVSDIVGRVVNAELHASHVSVVVPGHGLHLRGPDGFAFDRAGDCHLRRNDTRHGATELTT